MTREQIIITAIAEAAGITPAAAADVLAAQEDRQARLLASRIALHTQRAVRTGTPPADAADAACRIAGGEIGAAIARHRTPTTHAPTTRPAPAGYTGPTEDRMTITLRPGDRIVTDGRLRRVATTRRTGGTVTIGYHDTDTADVYPATGRVAVAGTVA